MLLWRLWGLTHAHRWNLASGPMLWVEATSATDIATKADTAAKSSSTHTKQLSLVHSSYINSRIKARKMVQGDLILVVRSSHGSSSRHITAKSRATSVEVVEILSGRVGSHSAPGQTHRGIDVLRRVVWRTTAKIR